MGVTCVFCGAKGETKEHIWPQWLRRAPGVPEELGAGRRIRTPYKKHKRTPAGVALQVDEGPQHQLVLAYETVRLCKECNGKLGRDLEEPAKKLTEDLIFHQRPVTLESEGQLILARWVAKIFLEYGLIFPDGCPFNAERYRELIEGVIPSGCAVAISVVDSKFSGMNLGFRVFSLCDRDGQPPESPNAAVGLVVAGQLVFTFSFVDNWDFDAPYPFPPAKVCDLAGLHLIPSDRPISLEVGMRREDRMDLIHRWVYSPEPRLFGVAPLWFDAVVPDESRTQLELYAELQKGQGGDVVAKFDEVIGRYFRARDTEGACLYSRRMSRQMFCEQYIGEAIRFASMAWDCSRNGERIGIAAEVSEWQIYLGFELPAPWGRRIEWAKRFTPVPSQFSPPWDGT